MLSALSSLRTRQLLAFLYLAAVVLLTGTAICILNYGLFFPFLWTVDIADYGYGITIDAGSHGTRGHLYQWDQRVEDVNDPYVKPITVPREVFTFEPGLKGVSEFANQSIHPTVDFSGSEETITHGGVGFEVLRPIISAMVENLTNRYNLTPSQLATVPIYLKATAGMRNMDIDTAESVFNQIRAYLLDEIKNPFKFKPDWARVISGEEEGVFGWLAVNSAHHTLMEPAETTIGALDLGGASAQITFMPTTASVLEDFYEADLGERVVRLYSHSFLGYGWDDSRMRVTTRLALGALFHSLTSDISRLETPLRKAVDIVKAIETGSLPSFHILSDKSRPHSFHPVNPSKDVDLEHGDASIEGQQNKPSSGHQEKDYSNDSRHDQLHESLTPKELRHAIYIDQSRSDTSVPIHLVEANHPCFSKGLESFFDVPNMMYPDGRFFLDIDNSALLSYMAIIGYNLQDMAQQQILQQFTSDNIALALNDPLSQATLESPMDGILQTFNRSDGSGLAQELSLAASESSPFHPFTRLLPSPRIKIRVLFRGTGDMRGCQDLAKQLFYREPCFLNSCSYNGVYQPRVGDSRFLALGQFAKVRAALDVPIKSTPNTLEKRASALCSTPWAELKAQHAAGYYQPFGKWALVNLCWKAVWAHATLTEGYGFDGESRAITFFDVKDEEGVAKSPGWAQGAMLNDVSSMPWASPRGRFKAPFWWSFVTTMTLLLIVFIQSSRIRSLTKTMPTARSDVYMQFSPDQIKL